MERPRHDALERPHPSRLEPGVAGYAAVLEAHRRAVAAGQPGYLDPSSGLFVLTAAEHLRRGTCCGRGCRHCPWVGGSSAAAPALYDERPQHPGGPMSDRVAVTITEGVADVRLNRPEKMNALDPGMFRALADTAASLAEDPSLRVVVLSGEGRAFCAGLDFSSFQAMASDDSAGSTEREAAPAEGISSIPDGAITHLGQQAVYGWTSLPVPVIAAVHGFALGGGIQLALGADIRFVSPDVQMSVLEIKWGLVPDMTGTQALINLVGLDVAKELTFTGRKVNGTEAVQIGLATHVADDPRAAALEMAAEIAGKSPQAVRAAKRLLNNASKISLAEGFAAERDEIGRLMGTPNQVEAVMAGFEKRAPRFSDPS